MEEREGKMPEVEELIRFLAEWLSLPMGVRMRLAGDETSKRKLEWWKKKIMENPEDLNGLIRLTKWLAKQMELSINEKAVLGAMIRQMEEERRQRTMLSLHHF